MLVQEDEMRVRYLILTVLFMAFAAPSALRAQTGEPGTCPNDSKLLNGGPTLVYGEGPGTFWDLVLGGFDAATAAGAPLGTDEERRVYLEQVFGRDFASLDEARQYNLDALSQIYDTNQNGYVCAFELRGTRAYSGDPYINFTTFGVSDDKIRK
jgi:hypothetical protein